MSDEKVTEPEKLLPLRQSDIDELERYCRFLEGEVSGIRCSSFEPRFGGGSMKRNLNSAEEKMEHETGEEFTPHAHRSLKQEPPVAKSAAERKRTLPKELHLCDRSSEPHDFLAIWDQMYSKLEPAGAMRRMTNIRRYLEQTAEGSIHWGVLTLYYSPVAHESNGRRVSRTPIDTAFGELAPLARFTVSARAAAERLFAKDRKAFLDKQEDLKLRGLSPLRSSKKDRTDAVAESMAWLDANLALQPTAIQHDYFVALAIDAAVKKSTSPLVLEIKVEARDMWRAACDAFRRAKTALGQDTPKKRTQSTWTSTDRFRPIPMPPGARR